MPFHDEFGDGPDWKGYFDGNDDVRDSQEIEVPTLNVTPLSYKIPMQPTLRIRPRREDCQTPGTTSSRPDGTSNGRGTTDAGSPSNN
uniref:Uncharacterized protein n=1 Tax=Cannabis sativa TaxID=3483 RepID=A0A803PZH6_CANSA